jgi:arylformamidase
LGAKPPERRAVFDAEVSFTNGGRLQTQGFRLDIPGSDITDAELGELFLHHLGLLMAGQVTVRNKRIVDEAHKGSRGTATAAAPEARRLVELSHPIEQGMLTYPGLPGPKIGEFLTREESRERYAPGTEFSIGRISMVGNTGTYLDSPFHRYTDGLDLAGLPLERLADLDGLVVRLADSRQRAIERAALVAHEVAGRAVLLHTGWARHWHTEHYAEGHPFVTADAAAWLAEQGPALVGIDSLNIDDTTDPARPAHSTLLAADIPIVEHLTGLEQLPVSGFRFHAVPAPVAGMTSWPVRAYAVIG